MDGFLVIVRCSVDDVPVRLFSTLSEAVTAASGLTLRQVEASANAAGFLTSYVEPIDDGSVQIVEFRSGSPVRTHVQEFSLSDADDDGPDKVKRLADELYGTTLTSGTERLQQIAVELWDIAAADRVA
jgi:hypothetical protein